MKRLTDTWLKAALKKERVTPQVDVTDGTVPGLFVRLGNGDTATWSLQLRVAGEGGVSGRGHRRKGRKHRLTLGTYPAMSIEAARAKANELRDKANKGENPVAVLEGAATACGPTVRDLSKVFMKEYVDSRGLDSASKYEMAFDTHINPQVGEELAEFLTREQVRKVMDAARVKRKRPPGRGGGYIGGVEAARTAMGVFRHMYSWGMDEGKLNRKDNPVSKITKNLPKKKEGEVVLSLREARIVWDASEMTGYPFGSQTQLQLLTGTRLDELASARVEWIDMNEALLIVSADEYKSDHVHVVPLVPQAIEILKRIPRPTKGPYLFSSTDGSVPIQGVAKYYRTRLADAIIAITGAKFPKKLTSHVNRRTVATRIAEVLGDEGDKLVKRVLGHADRSVTAVYNRYAYVKEMRRVLETWANDLTARPAAGQSASAMVASQAGSC